MPPGLNTGQQINLMIDRETIACSSIPSFNDLPIPFRCVSTELVSGKAYVFQDGSLSDVLRATIFIPGLFAPVRRGNQIFVDGGLVDNLPTDAVRQMGADVVIAVHLEISKASAKEIQSAFEVLGRSVELVLAESEVCGMAGELGETYGLQTELFRPIKPLSKRFVAPFWMPVKMRSRFITRATRGRFTGRTTCLAVWISAIPLTGLTS